MSQPRERLGKVSDLPLLALRLDGGTQHRLQLSLTAVKEYAEKLDLLDLPVVFQDPARDYWLADGFHTWEAHRLAGRKKIRCEVRAGSQLDAFRYSLSANETHGVRLEPEDRRNKVKNALRRNQSDHLGWSHREIALYCHVSHTWVNDLAVEMATPPSAPQVEAVSNSSQNGGHKTAAPGFVCACGASMDHPAWHCPNPACGEHNEPEVLVCEGCGTDRPHADEEAAWTREVETSPDTLVAPPVTTVSEKSAVRKNPGTGLHNGAPIHDCLGQVVPGHLRDVFGDPRLSAIRSEVEGWLTTVSCKEVLVSLQKRQPFLPFLQLAELVRHAEDLTAALACFHDILQNGLPYAICPTCQGQGCAGELPDGCRVTGYVPRWLWEKVQGGRGQKA